MVTPSQIAEMAENKYPLMETQYVMGQLKECIELHNQTQLDRRDGYIAAFADAMELMSKTNVPLSEVENILNTACHPDYASELTGYMRGLLGAPLSNGWVPIK